MCSLRWNIVTDAPATVQQGEKIEITKRKTLPSHRLTRICRHGHTWSITKNSLPQSIQSGQDGPLLDVNTALQISKSSTGPLPGAVDHIRQYTRLAANTKWHKLVSRGFKTLCRFLWLMHLTTKGITSEKWARQGEQRNADCLTMSFSPENQLHWSIFVHPLTYTYESPINHLARKIMFSLNLLIQGPAWTPSDHPPALPEDARRPTAPYILKARMLHHITMMWEKTDRRYPIRNADNFTITIYAFPLKGPSRLKNRSLFMAHNQLLEQLNDRHQTHI